MSDIRVRIGRPTEVVHLEHHADAEAFVGELRQSGLEVGELEVVEYGGGRGVVRVEWIFIFLGPEVASSLISDVTDDLYAAAKKWARRRYHRKKSEGESRSRPVGFLIYGPDGKELRKWTMLDDKASESTRDGSAY